MTVKVDPAVCFGEPQVKGVKVYIIAERFAGGECIDEIADDYGLTSGDVFDALRYELKYRRQSYRKGYK